MNGAKRAEAEVRQATREAAPWVVRLARAGYAARGIIYVLMGIIAARAALRSGDPADMRETMGTVENQPGGDWLVGALAVGLVGFALWRLVQAALDPEGKGRESQAKGAAHRVRYLFGAVVHLALAYTAFNLATHRGGSGGGGGWYRAAVSPLGGALLLVAAAGLVVYGGYQLVRAAKSKLDDELDLGKMNPEARTWAIRAARAGLAARGVVFALIGYLAYRASRHDSAEQPGIEGALRTLLEQPYGKYLLLLVAIGLVGYGIFELTRAFYRRIQPT
jgi:hypothetical protein